MVAVKQKLSSSYNVLTPLQKAIFAAGLFIVGQVAYIGFEPSQIWILLLTAGIAFFAVMSTGSHRSNSFFDSLITAVLPVIGIIAGGLFVKTQFGGYEASFIAIGVGLLGGLLIYIQSLDSIYEDKWKPKLRVLLLLLTYPIAFSLFHYVEELSLNLPLNAIACGLIAFLLGFEIFRTRVKNDQVLFLLCFVSALSIVQIRLVLFFFPLDPLILSALIIIGFYTTTGLLIRFSQVEKKLLSLLEYSLIAGLSIAGLLFFWV